MAMAQSTEAVLDLVDATHDALERVWDLEAPDAPEGYAYGQSRMEHLLTLIGEALLGYLQSQFDGLHIWTGSFQAVESRLRFGLRLITRFEKAVQDLTHVMSRHHHQVRGCDWSHGVENSH
jgi:hypothetical protein